MLAWMSCSYLAGFPVRTGDRKYPLVWPLERPEWPFHAPLAVHLTLLRDGKWSLRKKFQRSFNAIRHNFPSRNYSPKLFLELTAKLNSSQRHFWSPKKHLTEKHVLLCAERLQLYWISQDLCSRYSLCFMDFCFRLWRTLPERKQSMRKLWEMTTEQHIEKENSPLIFQNLHAPLEQLIIQFNTNKRSTH